MARLIKLVFATAVILSANISYGWGDCSFEFVMPEEPTLDCSTEIAVYTIEAKIISDEPLSPGINCKWGNIYGRDLETLDRVGDVCRARLTVKHAELHWLTVNYKSGSSVADKTKPCRGTGMLEVKATCCTPL